MEKVAIFVDVQNVYYTTKQCYRRHFDYNAFWAEASANRNVVKAIAYAIDRGDEKQRQFQNILRGIGFEVKLKPYIQRKDGSAKGDWDVGITLDVMEYSLESLQKVDSDPVQSCVMMSMNQWNSTLAGLETFMADHCQAMIDYHNLE